jgi:hypothetical protein
VNTSTAAGSSDGGHKQAWIRRAWKEAGYRNLPSMLIVVSTMRMYVQGRHAWMRKYLRAQHLIHSFQPCLMHLALTHNAVPTIMLDAAQQIGTV